MKGGEAWCAADVWHEEREEWMAPPHQFYRPSRKLDSGSRSEPLMDLFREYDLVFGGRRSVKVPNLFAVRNRKVSLCNEAA